LPPETMNACTQKSFTLYWTCWRRRISSSNYPNVYFIKQQ
jgi:hypothetical protein